jgi:hypothetical protein
VELQQVIPAGFQAGIQTDHRKPGSRLKESLLLFVPFVLHLFFIVTLLLRFWLGLPSRLRLLHPLLLLLWSRLALYSRALPLWLGL